MQTKRGLPRTVQEVLSFRTLLRSPSSIDRLAKSVLYVSDGNERYGTGLGDSRFGEHPEQAPTDTVFKPDERSR